MSDPLRDLENTIHALERTARETGADLMHEIGVLRTKFEGMLHSKGNPEPSSVPHTLTRWERVQLARVKGRPTGLDYVERAFEDFEELAGDRAFGNDQALIGGPATLQGRSVMLLVQQKGRDTKGNIKRNFGMSHPEGYRKAARLMNLAEKFKLPLIALIDTPGAYPGLAAEERGQAWAIAESIARMASLKVPTLSIIIGEGGSGGALALGIGNVVLMLENAWYSVISPESCAAILWRDSKEAARAAEALKLTAHDLLELRIVDEIIPEPAGGAHNDVDATVQNFSEVVSRQLEGLNSLSSQQILESRRERFLGLGAFELRK